MNDFIAIPRPAKSKVFSYDDLPSDTAALARRAADDVRLLQKEALAGVGAALLKAKEALGHGAFGKWLAAEFEMSARTAENYMGAARFLGGKSETVSYLPSTIVYALSAPSADPAIVDAVLADVDAGKPIYASAVKSLLADAAKARAAVEAAAKRTPEMIKKEQAAAKSRRAAQARRDAELETENAAIDAKRAANAERAAALLIETLDPEILREFRNRMMCVQWTDVRHAIDRLQLPGLQAAITAEAEVADAALAAEFPDDLADSVESLPGVEFTLGGAR